MSRPGLYAAIAVRSFRRYATYRAATLAGLFTNTVFGLIYSFVYLQLWQESPGLGGYDAADAVTYVWIGQGLIMTVALWNGGPTDDIAERVRTGDIAIDFYRPVNLLSWYLAADLGRSVFHVLTRGIGPIAIAAVLFDLTAPDGLVTVAAFALSVLLAIVVSFGLRFLVAGTSFWLFDVAGARMLSGALAVFFSGLALPLNVFPEPWATFALNLPWAAMLQAPADVWLGTNSGADLALALCRQAAWAAVLLGAGMVMLRAAERRVVVQGG